MFHFPAFPLPRPPPTFSFFCSLISFLEIGIRSCFPDPPKWASRYSGTLRRYIHITPTPFLTDSSHWSLPQFKTILTACWQSLWSGILANKLHTVKLAVLFNQSHCIRYKRKKTDLAGLHIGHNTSRTYISYRVLIHPFVPHAMLHFQSHTFCCPVLILMQPFYCSPCVWISSLVLISPNPQPVGHPIVLKTHTYLLFNLIAIIPPPFPFLLIPVLPLLLPLYPY